MNPRDFRNRRQMILYHWNAPLTAPHIPPRPIISPRPLAPPQAQALAHFDLSPLIDSFTAAIRKAQPAMNTYSYTDTDGDNLKVQAGSGTADDSALVSIQRRHDSNTAAVFIPAADAPAAALALLKAAGFDSVGVPTKAGNDHRATKTAVTYLQAQVQKDKDAAERKAAEEARKAAEEARKAREEERQLDAEAERIYHALNPLRFRSFAELGLSAKDNYRNAARVSRSMHKEG